MPETAKKQPPLYTMLEVAKITGCSKSTVYRVVKDNHLKRKKKKGQASLYDETLIKLVKSKLEEDTKSREAVQRNALNALEKQLESKDKTIDQLNKQLEMAQANLHSSLEIQRQQAEKIKLLEEPKRPAAKLKRWWEFWKEE